MIKQLVVAAGLITLVGCSAPAEEPQVASLGTTSASSAKPTAEAEQPRDRIDQTKDEEVRLREPWRKCMTEHGVDLDKFKNQKAITKEEAAAHAEATRPAREACKTKEVLPPWEYDKNNPESKDFVHRVVLCMRAKGVNVEEKTNEDGSPGFAFANDSVSKGLDSVKPCEKESIK